MFKSTSRFSVSDIHAGEGQSLTQKRMIKQIIMMLGCSVAFLFMVTGAIMNQNSTMGYALQEVRIDRYDLQTTLEKLEIELANESTLYSFRTSKTVQNMKRIEKPKYVSMESQIEVAFKGQ